MRASNRRISHFFTLGQVEVPTRIGSNGLILKREHIDVIGDNPKHYPPLFALAISPDLLDFLIDHLPHGDDFTRALEELREDAKQTLWDRWAA